MAVSLVPVSSEQDRTSCPNCSAPLAPDQRYCLTCGQPVSPVRLEFLDFLASESQPQAGQAPLQPLTPGYVTVIEPSTGPDGWLRRYSGLFGLAAVLLMSIIVGLLVGHWVTQNKAPSQQVIKIEGLSGAPLAAAATTATSTPPATTSSQPAAASKADAKAEAAEAKEAKVIEKAPPPKPVKVSAAKLQKLGNTTGKKHEEEIAKLGNEPIETGG